VNTTLLRSQRRDRVAPRWARAASGLGPSAGAARAALGAATLAFVSACSVDETVTPLSAGTTTTSVETTTTTTTTTGTPPEPGPAKRTVTVRSPLGGPANNLLFDGDFEISVAGGTGQYGWRMFNSAGTGELPMTVETGGLCRTGLTCAKVHKSELLLGRGTAAANGKGHVMEVWAKLPADVGCNKLQAMAIDCDTFVVLKPTVAPKELEDGWCHYQGAFNQSHSAVCMYIQTSLAADQEALVDSAVIGPNDGTVPLKDTPVDPVDSDTLARMQTLADYVRRTTRLTAPAATTSILRE